MTVAEVIAKLQTYPQDSRVCGTWEGTLHGLTPDCFYGTVDGSVMIDVELLTEYISATTTAGLDRDWKLTHDQHAPLGD
jgi:hypothetical protein